MPKHSSTSWLTTIEVFRDPQPTQTAAAAEPREQAGPVDAGEGGPVEGAEDPDLPGTDEPGDPGTTADDATGHDGNA